MAKNLTILITGAGSPGAPGVIKSLRGVDDCKLTIIGIDINPLATGKALVDKFYVGPKATDQNFVEEMLGLCRRENIDVVLPMVSQELMPLSKHIQLFKDIGTEVSVSNPHFLNTALNKGRLFEHLNKKGFLVPKYSIVHSPKDLQKALEDLCYPQKSVCMKPTMSDGSRGFRILDNEKDRLELLYFEKPSSVYISESELLETLENVSTIPETIVMEYLPYEEYSVDILANEGNVFIAIPRLREEVINGISVKSTVVYDKEIIDYAISIVNELNLHGNIGVQIRKDINHQPKIIEINPRIQGTIVHCTAAGVNLPYLAIKMATGQPINSYELDIQWGIKMVRYWEEFYLNEEGNVI